MGACRSRRSASEQREEMPRLLILTWEQKAPHRINAVSAAHRRSAMAYGGIDVHKKPWQMCIFTEAGEVGIASEYVFAQFISICRWLQLIHKNWLAPLSNAVFSTP